MRFLLSILVAVVCFGCSTHKAKEEITRAQMTRLKKGMTDQGVSEILGKPAQVQQHGEYVVWFYVTQPLPAKEKISDQYFTPIVFKNGYLMDWGYYYYNYLLGEEHSKKSVSYLEQQPPVPEQTVPAEPIQEMPVPQEPSPSQEAEPLPSKEDASDHKSLWE
jgi:outer membrane protein assembly factor BamE (lipoprotein component of BamABCDE complex)